MSTANREHGYPLAGYEPTRPARLRGATDEPPPLPPPVDDADGFGSADEDGLRMLAALETLTSLEPDYSDDLTAEASVTIIEAAGYDVVAEALARDPADGRSLRALLQGRDEPPRLLLNGYETFGGARRGGHGRDRPRGARFRGTRDDDKETDGQPRLAGRAHRRRHWARRRRRPFLQGAVGRRLSRCGTNCLDDGGHYSATQH